MAEIEHRYRCVGVDDEASTCSCCGRKNLKTVVWLVDVEDGSDAEPYGTTCAALMLTGRKVPRREAFAIVDADLRARADEITTKWQRTAAPHCELTINKYDVALWRFDDGVEILAVGAPFPRFDEQRHRHDSTLYARREWRTKKASEEIRRTLRGYVGPVFIDLLTWHQEQQIAWDDHVARTFPQ